MYTSGKKISKKNLILVGAIGASVVILVVVFMTMMKPPPPPPEEEETGPIYQVEINDVRFKLKEVKDRGNILKLSEGRDIRPGRKDATTTERYIQVTIGAENIGTEETKHGGWNIGEIVDSEGRRFSYDRYLDNWILETSECGKFLKPGFSPTYCTKIYEVAKVSTGLKVEVLVGRTAELIDLGL